MARTEREGKEPQSHSGRGERKEKGRQKERRKERQQNSFRISNILDSVASYTN
jgi:hypothetical protein